MNKQEFIKRINEEAIGKTQECYCEDIEEDFPFIREENIKYKIIKECDIEEHRWYETSDAVFLFSVNGEEFYLKTRLLTKLYSESNSVGDCYHKYGEFKEVFPKEKIITIYE